MAPPRSAMTTYCTHSCDAVEIPSIIGLTQPVFLPCTLPVKLYDYLPSFLHCITHLCSVQVLSLHFGHVFPDQSCFLTSFHGHQYYRRDSLCSMDCALVRGMFWWGQGEIIYAIYLSNWGLVFRRALSAIQDVTIVFIGDNWRGFPPMVNSIIPCLHT